MRTRMTPWAILVALPLMLTLALPPTTYGHNADNYSEDFEAFADGQSIIGTGNWLGNLPEDAVVESWDYVSEDLYTGNLRPMPGSTHAKVLHIQADSTPITNLFTSGTAGGTNWVDHIINPVFMDTEDGYPDVPEDALVAYFFTSNGTLVVSSYDIWTDFENATQEWIDTDQEIGSNDFVRITIMVKFDDLNEFLPIPFYRIYLNEQEIYHAQGYDQPDWGMEAPSGGYWLPAGNQTKEQLSEIEIRGTAYLDELVVRSSSPFTHALVRLVSTRGGATDPAGDVFLPIPSSLPVTITPSNFWFISDVIVDGLHHQGAVSNHTLEITNSYHQLQAVFEAYATDDVPHWWMNDHLSITNNFETWVTNRWHLSKPLTIGEEYWASTDPLDPDSLFKIATIGVTNEVPYVRWYSDAIDPALNDMGNYFLIYRTTNVADQAAWTNVMSVLRQADNLWEDLTAPTNGVFYQIRVNPAP